VEATTLHAVVRHMPVRTVRRFQTRSRGSPTFTGTNRPRSLAPPCQLERNRPIVPDESPTCQRRVRQLPRET